MRVERRDPLAVALEAFRAIGHNGNVNRRDLLIALGGAAVATPKPPVPELLTRPIGSSDERLPVIGIGTSGSFNVGASDTERAPIAEVLQAFVELGGRVVDTSPMYAHAEAVTGDVAAKLAVREKLFLATKVWSSGKKAGIAQMEESFRKLRTKQLDLLQVHNLIDVDTQLETLAAWKKEGRVRWIGITHYVASAHEEVARLLETKRVDFVQINYSAAEREAEKLVLPVATKRGVAVIANRPFGGGELVRGLKGTPLPSWAAEIDCTSWAQVLLKFVVSHPAITCAIPATSKVAHLRDNMQAGRGRLPDEALRAKIAAAVEP